MWDSRYGDLAAARLAEQREAAAANRAALALRPAPRRLRVAIGSALVRAGQRLAASAGAPARVSVSP